MKNKKLEYGQKKGVRPILLSGVYRSGTTFLTAVINNLPNIAAASSTVKYLRFCAPHFDNLHDDETLKKLIETTAKRIKARWGLNLEREAIHSRLSGNGRNHADVYDEIMSALLLGENNGATRWSEKLAMQWEDIPVFLSMFPDGQVVHIFRDPRDVTSSYKKMTYEPWPTFLDAALNCQSAFRSVPKYQEQFGDDKIAIIRAEDLASDLEGSLTELCRFLDEPFDSSLADLSKVSDIKGEDWRTNTSFDGKEDNFSKAQPRWMENLSAEELFLVESICQPEMSNFGYAGSGQTLHNLDSSEVGKILQDPWLGKRVEHYLKTGKAQQGYRTDPFQTEMKIVFGEEHDVL